jgi:hypothetical protein
VDRPTKVLTPSPLGYVRGAHRPPAYLRAMAHVDSCDAALARFTNASPRELAALLNARATALRSLAAAEPAWVKLLESLEWQLVEQTFMEALRPFPDAAKAVEGALHDIGVQAGAAGTRVELGDQVDDDGAQVGAQAGEA